MNRCKTMMLASGAAAALVASTANAQSLFQRPVSQPLPANAQRDVHAANGGADGAKVNGADGASNGNGGNGNGGAVGSSPSAPMSLQARAGGAGLPLDQVSLFMVVPPTPKAFGKHDKLEIIVNETSLQKFEQTLESKKNMENTSELQQFPSLQDLFLHGTLRNGIGTPAPSMGIKNNNNYKGDGTYTRTDQFTARLSGLVIDVKPNGLLVIEAKEVMQSDKETKTLVVSGVCDPKDITTGGTVQAEQMADLVIKVQHEGQVKDTAQKGLIPQVIEAIFNF